MNEHSYIRSIHRLLPKNILIWKVNDTFASGVPDAFYAGPRGTLFIEYKYVKKLPVRSATKIKTCITPIQLLWLNRYQTFGHEAYVVVGCGCQSIIVDDFKSLQALNKKDFLENQQNTAEVAAFILSKIA